ncbi:uncharacterized protein B0H64DRAFT_409616 [Chaetomium fimeti]|uniref:Uncharacterized protein n=1 Tax=Chaetomium fimeti TaxID=1854472 RepID=A0AAE0H853_9PEZI|nr:hypothetical protein B0H64DRAFT_409616 [Chaetomium fimeti]
MGIACMCEIIIGFLSAQGVLRGQVGNRVVWRWRLETGGWADACSITLLSQTIITWAAFAQLSQPRLQETVF